MNIIVAGAGAIGGTVAVLLKEAGYDVRIMCHSDATRKLIEEDGFFLNGAKGEHRVDFTCYSDVSEFGDEKFDIIIMEDRNNPYFALSYL